MGLIKAVLSSTKSVLQDQWKEFFYCDSLEKDVLAVRGKKSTSKRSVNKGSDNIISNGSGIVVADGQCMMIVEQGKVVEFCAEPGNFTYSTSSEPSIFAGKLGESILESFKTLGKRITFGGSEGKDQRVYYFNLKEIMDNKFGSSNPIPFRVVDSKIGLDLDVSIRCSGVYSYRITDPMVFYANVCGNITGEYRRDELDSQLKTEFISALQPAFGKLSDLQLRPNQIVSHTTDLENAMNAVLSEKWKGKRGIEVSSVAIGSLTLPEEDQQAIKDAQQSVFYGNPTNAAGTIASATAQAMKNASKNPNGSMAGFMGMGMAMNAGMGNLSGLFAQQNQQFAQNNVQNNVNPTSATPTPTQQSDYWVCQSCGAQNKGKFCMECGTKKPTGAPLFRCDKCGWQPKDPYNPPKFCPECGDIFDSNDIVK